MRTRHQNRSRRPGAGRKATARQSRHPAAQAPQTGYGGDGKHYLLLGSAYLALLPATGLLTHYLDSGTPLVLLLLLPWRRASRQQRS